MRFANLVLLLCLFCRAHGQFPYVKKLNYPEQLPTQVIYDMLTDTKGYIWFGTDKGLYRFNGRSFVSIPFDNTSSRSVSYLQEDNEGTIWCMNFYNQPFYFRKDTLRRFGIDFTELRESPTFSNMVVCEKQVWFHSFNNIYTFDKRTHRLLNKVPSPFLPQQVVTSANCNDHFYAYTPGGYFFSDVDNKWSKMPETYLDCRFLSTGKTLINLGAGFDRHEPFRFNGRNGAKLKVPQLPGNIYLIHGVYINDNEYWLCTQNGAYKWNTETGETRCYLPNERISDVVKDYQGNYWFSTLDNGVFVCASLDNSFLKIYNDPLLDNFTRLQALPDGEIVTGNSQGMLVQVNLAAHTLFQYDLRRQRETEFIMYDSVQGMIISNRGAFKPGVRKPVELMDYSKGVQRDKFGNLIVALFNEALVVNGHFNMIERLPIMKCALYQAHVKDIMTQVDRNHFLLLRKRRCLSLLSSFKKDAFWIGYDDGLYEYHYDGRVTVLKDAAGHPVIAKSLQQQPGGELVVGSSTKGVMVFSNGRLIRTFNEKDGLSSIYVRKVLVQDDDIWVLTDAGLDRVNMATGAITNYLEEYGLSNTIINDFIISRGKLLFATPAGILVRNNLPGHAPSLIKFPLLKASSNGIDLINNSALPGASRDISFYFEALHYLSTTALGYRYRVIGIDTIWRSSGNFTNQLTLNRLSPGNYVFEVKAAAGPNYRSGVQRFAFRVNHPYWQKAWFIAALALCCIGLASLSLRRWKKSVVRRQLVKEQVLKSQLVALRAQMNPHFLYNVLNTVQGLVYGNRKTEAGELLGNFSDLMRKTLQASDKQFLPLQDEIENLRLYLELEKARFDEGFVYTIETEDIQDLSFQYIPSLMLQPFAENSVKHGLMHKKGIKTVRILFGKKANGVNVVIDDNGIGRAQSMEINKRSKNKPFSFATAALNERINLFNRLYRQKITIHITDKDDEFHQPLGTRVELFIPDYNNDREAL